jgi:hypothetical protein
MKRERGEATAIPVQCDLKISRTPSGLPSGRKTVIAVPVGTFAVGIRLRLAQLTRPGLVGFRNRNQQQERLLLLLLAGAQLKANLLGYPDFGRRPL